MAKKTVTKKLSAKVRTTKKPTSGKAKKPIIAESPAKAKTAKKPTSNKAKKLVIVESPAKAKTIEKYLGKDFIVLASFGHVRDLLPKEGAVDPENDFAMRYEVIEKNAKHMAAIQKALKAADTLYLAPDPDREGEAIAWHVFQILQDKKALKNKSVHRVVFHEITKSAINEAIKNPRGIDMNLVNAQQARRALDYLVGFNLSPLLWRKIRTGLSAGRVQSPALRLIVEREAEIKAFEPQEYWTISADCQFKKQSFDAKLITYEGKKVEQFTFTKDKPTEKAKVKLLKEADGKLIVDKIEKKLRKRNPSPPFTTSTLQQDASRKLGFTAQKTMRVAQQLYEGVDVGEGSVGLITYMRTDSVNLAAEAISEIRDYIQTKFGKDNLPPEPKFYKTKAKNAQEAHEAIRPTSVFREPTAIKKALSTDQYKLYSLIWKRVVACQMVHATINTVAVDLLCGQKNTFRANGSNIVHPGFMKLYLESSETKDKDSEEKILPEMKQGDAVTLKDILCDQHFTEPPPRYSEASLVKTLEEYGIGRPSTYASIISTLQYRAYVTLEQKRFHPTDVGIVVSKFLTTYFTQYVDYGFTAKLEDELDEISRGEKVWVPLLKEFWGPFKKLCGTISETVQRKDVTQEEMDEECPKCGKKLTLRLGRGGRFIGCSGYPECDYTRSVNGDDDDISPEVVEGRECPKCGSPLQVKSGRFGKFIACTGYPKCKYVESLKQPTDTKVKCPKCHKGTMLKRQSRKGKIFYSCSEYPSCKYAVWNEPIDEKCPKCGWPMLTMKVTKKRGAEKSCPQEECSYVEAIPSDNE